MGRLICLITMDVFLLFLIILFAKQGQFAKGKKSVIYVFFPLLDRKSNIIISVDEKKDQVQETSQGTSEKGLDTNKGIKGGIILNIIFIILITQLSQQIFPNKACINKACDSIHSVTLLLMQDVISPDKVEMCSTNKAIRL